MARAEWCGGGANCDGMMWEENEDVISPGKVLIKLTLPVERAPVFVLNFILRRLSSILSPAKKKCYMDLEQSDSQPRRRSLRLRSWEPLEEYGLHVLLALFLLRGVRHPQVATFRRD